MKAEKAITGGVDESGGPVGAVVGDGAGVAHPVGWAQIRVLLLFKVRSRPEPGKDEVVADSGDREYRRIVALRVHGEGAGAGGQDASGDHGNRAGRGRSRNAGADLCGRIQREGRVHTAEFHSRHTGEIGAADEDGGSACVGRYCNRVSVAHNSFPGTLRSSSTRTVGRHGSSLNRTRFV